MAGREEAVSLAKQLRKQLRRRRRAERAAIAKTTAGGGGKRGKRRDRDKDRDTGKGKGKQRKLKKARALIRLPAAPSSPALPPWLLRVSAARHALAAATPLARLDAELADLARFCGPTPGETAARAGAVAAVSGAVTAMGWRGARVAAFGSFSTGLCGPDSDVDLSVLGAPAPFPPSGAHATDATRASMNRVTSALYAFVKQLKRHGVAVRDEEVIGRARVPIAKFRVAPGGVCVDVAFNQASGEATRRTVLRFLELCAPHVRPLFHAAKAVLQQADLNDPAYSGLGSYTLFNMVVYTILCRDKHLPTGKKKKKKEEEEKGRDAADGDSVDSAGGGALLLDFFTLWGGVDAGAINVTTTGVCIADGGSTYDRVQRFGEKRKNKKRPMGGLGVQDVDREDNELGSNCGRIKRLQQLFAACAAALQAWLDAKSAARRRQRHATPLSAILHATDAMRARREEVVAAMEEADGSADLLQNLDDAWSIKAVRKARREEEKAAKRKGKSSEEVSEEEAKVAEDEVTDESSDDDSGDDDDDDDDDGYESGYGEGLEGPEVIVIDD